MTEPLQPAPGPTEAARPTGQASSRVKVKSPWARLDKKNLAFGAAGLVLGLLLGLPVGSLAGGDDTTPATETVADIPAPKPIPGAVDVCTAAGTEGIDVLDNGASLEMKTAGKDYSEAGAPYSVVSCILDELHAPDSLISRMDGTRALDGTLDGQWDRLTASWTYHLDNGLRVIVETARK